MLRILIFLIISYIFYRIVRAVLAPPAAPRTNPGQVPPRPKPHKADFSDVQEAEFEDLTPPPPPPPPLKDDPTRGR